ncbi:DCC1-like thiol-disulfide oxidoreductase family protein [Aliiroseovarius halocynthiae]|uniref:DCC1-like thiol-disulfide oxidoreductase family protein n=1 Tax=Aliiroseovarius halocynthiae TaxID=985055 RepID=UPI0038996CCE
MCSFCADPRASAAASISRNPDHALSVAARRTIAEAWGEMSARYSYRHDPDVPDFDDSVPVAVMDAECALCSWGARMFHWLDRSGTVRICPIQSPLGETLSGITGLTRKTRTRGCLSTGESWLACCGSFRNPFATGCISASRATDTVCSGIAICARFPIPPSRNGLYDEGAVNRRNRRFRLAPCAFAGA